MTTVYILTATNPDDEPSILSVHSSMIAAATAALAANEADADSEFEATGTRYSAALEFKKTQPVLTNGADEWSAASSVGVDCDEDERWATVFYINAFPVKD